jgi:hypothetical protein
VLKLNKCTNFALCYKADESADESKKVSFSKRLKSEIKIGLLLMRQPQISYRGYLEPVTRLINCHFGQLIHTFHVCMFVMDMNN